MRKPLENLRAFVERRQKVAEQLKNGVLIVSSGPEAMRNGSVPHPFRQDTNLYYLTGFEEPESILVFRPGQKPETVMFVRERNPERETWDGFRFGPELTKQEFKIDEAYTIDQFPAKIADLIGTADSVHYRYFKNPEVDKLVDEALQAHKMSLGRTGLGLLPVHDADELIAELRVIKTDMDLLNHRMACEISSLVHAELMKATRPGMNEREIEGLFMYQIMKRGAARPGYNTIVAGGANACTLHYVFNDQTLKSGDLLLIDAGAEYNYFTGDITRTFPVNGKFTAAQAEVYEGVLKIQKTVIDAVRPGAVFQDLQDLAASLLTDLMLQLGLFEGRKEDIIAANKHRKYYPHGVSHFLGMDVHDAGQYRSRDGQNRVLEPGMVLTVEPGLYIPADDTAAPERFRGIGIRIEDNILVTANGNDNLTKACPREIAEIEALMKS